MGQMARGWEPLAVDKEKGKVSRKSEMMAREWSPRWQKGDYHPKQEGDHCQERGAGATNRKDGALFALLEAVAFQTMPGEERYDFDQCIFKGSKVKIIFEKKVNVTYKMQ